MRGAGREIRRAMHHRHPLSELPVISPPQAPDAIYTDPVAAVADLRRRYDAATGYLRETFAEVMAGRAPEGRCRAFYPLVSFTTASFVNAEPVGPSTRARNTSAMPPCPSSAMSRYLPS